MEWVRAYPGTPGVWTPDEGVPGDAYLAELRRRGIEVNEIPV